MPTDVKYRPPTDPEYFKYGCKRIKMDIKWTAEQIRNASNYVCDAVSNAPQKIYDKTKATIKKGLSWCIDFNSSSTSTTGNQRTQELKNVPQTQAEKDAKYVGNLNKNYGSGFYNAINGLFGGKI